MARYDMHEAGIGSTAQAEILFELGLMYATGRDCDIDLIAAHKWLNIAAIKGSETDIAKALREAREWMTVH